MSLTAVGRSGLGLSAFLAQGFGALGLSKVSSPGKYGWSSGSEPQDIEGGTAMPKWCDEAMDQSLRRRFDS